MRSKLLIGSVAAGAALLIATPLMAEAAGFITGRDIVNNTVASKDIKNNTIKITDLKPATVAALRGQNGTNGAPGASAFAPPPSGTVIRGSGLEDIETSTAGTQFRSYANLPFTTATALLEDSNLLFSPGSDTMDSYEDAVKCPLAGGEPNPAAGVMCVHVTSSTNVTPNSVEPFGGTLFDADAADRTGFTLRFTAAAAGQTTIRYIWAYKAP